MNLRQRLLITFALVVVIVVALVAYAVSLRTRSAFEQVDQERTGALVAEFRSEFQSQGRDVVRKLERIARTDDLQRLALESAQGGDMSSVPAAGDDSGAGVWPRLSRNPGCQRKYHFVGAMAGAFRISRESSCCRSERRVSEEGGTARRICARIDGGASRASRRCDHLSRGRQASRPALTRDALATTGDVRVALSGERDHLQSQRRFRGAG